MDTIEQLAPYRKTFVVAAEEVAPVVAAAEKIAKTQLNHLIAVCSEATCAEEITRRR